MSALDVIMILLLVLAVVAVAIWQGLRSPDSDHLAERARLEAEERMAIWQLRAIRYQAEAEMRRLSDARRSRTPSKRESPSP